MYNYVDMTKNLGNLSKKALMDEAGTTSLKILEKSSVGNVYDNKIAMLAGIYIYNNNIRINKFDYSVLVQLVEIYQSALEERNPNNPFYKIHLELLHELEQSNRDKNIKNLSRDAINALIKEKNISIISLSRKYNINYSQIHQFLKKNNNNKISVQLSKQIWEDLQEY